PDIQRAPETMVQCEFTKYTFGRKTTLVDMAVTTALETSYQVTQPHALKKPGRLRLIMLCDRARVLARSDRPETMPEIRKAAPRCLQRPLSWDDAQLLITQHER